MFPDFWSRCYKSTSYCPLNEYSRSGNIIWQVVMGWAILRGMWGQLGPGSSQSLPIAAPDRGYIQSGSWHFRNGQGRPLASETPKTFCIWNPQNILQLLTRAHCHGHLCSPFITLFEIGDTRKKGNWRNNTCLVFIKPLTLLKVVIALCLGFCRYMAKVMFSTVLIRAFDIYWILSYARTKEAKTKR